MRPNAHRAVELLHDLIAFDTVSRNSNLKLIDYAADYLAGVGVECELIRDDSGAKANLFATIGGPAGVPGIVLSGHTDVVPVDGQDWSSDPFSLTERDGKLFGRGTCDMKGFIAICLAMAPVIARADLKRPIHFAFSYDEEVGCRGVAGMIEKIAGRSPLPRACIVGEPTSMRAVTAHKGIRAFETVITGRESHSSNTEFGVSAIMAGGRLIEFLRAILAEMKARGDDTGRFDPPYTSLNIGTIDGGSALNITPNRCRMVWEYRPLPQADEDEIISRFDAFSRDVEAEMRARFDGASIVTTQIARAPALLRQPNSPAEELVRALTGENDSLTAAYVTEAGLFQLADIPTVVCGPGSIDQAHRPDEFIELSQMDAGTDFIEKLVAALSA
ncbi:acetylornithine deacetylase [Emcibacter sp. SYSU 3D8]|uniref:acetylornithine deacetylase n=1 Tax=Emcibacter sp. SYSU 3D8 TaxID=3133969 RepID=UPI0031FF35D1